MSETPPNLSDTSHNMDYSYPEQAHQDVSSGHSDRSPLGSGPLGFLKSLTSDKKQTKDGQPAKRRGPKPDSKPALTRRQELNRQAQRTHRERKELYIKNLEQELLQLKERFIQESREKEAVAAENAQLRELLRQHGIAYDFSASPITFRPEARSAGVTQSSSSISGSYRGTSESTGLSPSNGHAHYSQSSNQSPPSALVAQPQSMAAHPSREQAGFDELGIDFVLTLERPCMIHTQHLMVRSHNPEKHTLIHPLEHPDDFKHDHMSGHALMATSVPWSHLMDTPQEVYPHQVPTGVQTSALVKLLNLSASIPFSHEGEITPVMAWARMFSHQRAAEFDRATIERVKTKLSERVRCYGFGAVLEDFELQEAIQCALADKDRPAALTGSTLPPTVMSA